MLLKYTAKKVKIHNKGYEIAKLKNFQSDKKKDKLNNKN